MAKRKFTIRGLFRRSEKNNLNEKAVGVPTGSFQFRGNTFFFSQSQILDYTYNKRNFLEYAENGFGRNPHVYAVVGRISKNLAMMPRAWFADYEGEELIDPNQDTNKIKEILKRSGYEGFLELMAYQYLIHGNVIVYYKNPVGFEGSLDQITLCVARMQDVTVETHNGKQSGIPVRYWISTEDQYFDAENVLHIAMPNAIEDSYFGLSPLHTGQSTYVASNNNMSAQAAIHQNRGASGILSPKDGDVPLLADQQDEMQAEFNRRSAGINKFGGVLVSSQAMTYTPIGMNVTDLKLIEGDMQLLRQICNIYGVSSALFNDPEGSTYNNMREAKEAYYLEVLYPLSRVLDLSLSAYLSNLMRVKDVYWQVHKDKVRFLNKVDTALSDKVIKETQAGILPPVEALRILYPDIAERVEQQNTQN